MKNSILNVRLDRETKNAIEHLSEINNIPVSRIVRDAINNYLKSTQVSKPSENDKDLAVLQSLGFLELIYFIMDKKRNPDMLETTELYQQHIDLILELKDNPYFDNEILKEFDKVRFELENVLRGFYIYSNFRFSQDEFGFDYEKLHLFIHTIRYDDNDVQFLFIK